MAPRSSRPTTRRSAGHSAHPAHAPTPAASDNDNDDERGGAPRPPAAGRRAGRGRSRGRRTPAGGGRPPAGGGSPAGAARRRLRPPLRLRHLLPLVVLFAMMAMLLLRGYVHSEVLADHRVRPDAAADRVPQAILDGGPVVDTRGGRTASREVPDHRLVLTFDDGPDPEWTPKVLDVLAKHHAHAVFFVTGTMASRYPDLVRRMVDEGHEIGLHTFNHPDLSFQSKKRIDWELSQNQLALTGAAGIRTSLFRPPYSSFADAMDDKSWPVTEYIGS
ncbi:polysaccharide deacetylase family protein, partial [Streptomyces sp. NPDC051051]|uniref:polysaccharide deacetylase family protein n=1 Tax=Streptomyces sp. NPDC051051 TaxID=3155666 RepID=UPI003413CAF5